MPFLIQKNIPIPLKKPTMDDLVCAELTATLAKLEIGDSFECGVHPCFIKPICKKLKVHITTRHVLHSTWRIWRIPSKHRVVINKCAHSWVKIGAEGIIIREYKNGNVDVRVIVCNEHIRQNGSGTEQEITVHIEKGDYQFIDE